MISLFDPVIVPEIDPWHTTFYWYVSASKVQWTLVPNGTVRSPLLWIIPLFHSYIGRINRCRFQRYEQRLHGNFKTQVTGTNIARHQSKGCCFLLYIVEYITEPGWTFLFEPVLDLIDFNKGFIRKNASLNVNVHFKIFTLDCFEFAILQFESKQCCFLKFPVILNNTLRRFLIIPAQQ